MTKELEALKRIKEYLTRYNDTDDIRGIDYENEVNVIETALKALEIIKEHKLLNYVLKNKKCANMYHLSEEDKESLKEVLF